MGGYQGQESGREGSGQKLVKGYKLPCEPFNEVKFAAM